MSCSEGKIKRSGYSRKAYTRSDGKLVRATRVPPTCIQDRGLPGKGPKIIPKLRKGTLSPYHVDLTIKARHDALRKVVKRSSALTVFRKLGAVAIMLKNTSPEAASILKKDQRWVRKTFQKEFKTSLPKLRAK